jgi:hypothetical protein
MADDVVWGTGYGSKRHIPDERGIQERESARVSSRRRWAQAACSSTVFLETFADGADRDFVMAKTPCTRCAKKAGVVACPTCNGAGTVAPS